MDKLRVLKEGGKDTKIFGAVGEIGEPHLQRDRVLVEMHPAAILPGGHAQHEHRVCYGGAAGR